MIDKLGSSPDPALESILANIHENAVGTQYADATPTNVPDGKVVIADNGAGVKSVSVKTGEGNILTLTGIPSGFIGMWSGTIATIPSGWYLCDGNNGTPNLTNRFIYGASDGSAAGNASPGSSGGLSAGLAGNDNAVTMSTVAYAATDTPRGDIGNNVANVAHLHNVMPAYYALCFIMKA